MYERMAFHVLMRRLSEPRRFLQVLAGPRQAGKTTLARQAMVAAGFPSHYASADEPILKDGAWLEQQWESARTLLRQSDRQRKGVLVLDEIQKIPAWSETVKCLETSVSRDVLMMTRVDRPALLSGSSSLRAHIQARYFPTRKCSASCRTRETRRHLHTTWSFFKGRAL